MRLARARSPHLIALVVLTAGSLSGCSTFKAHKRIDVSPFAENTLAMIGEMQKFNRPVVWSHLREYKTLPSVEAAESATIPIRTLLRGIGFYSGHVVSLYESSLPESQKITSLASYMDEYIRPALAKADPAVQHYGTSDLDSVTARVRDSPSLLAALGAAQPLINATMDHGNLLFDRLDSLARAAALDVGTRHDAKYLALTTRIDELDRMHVASIRSYTLLQRYRAGDAAALDSLRQTDPAVMPFMPAGLKSSVKELDAAEHFVTERSSTIKSLRDQLEPEFQDYKAGQQELEDLLNQADDRARLGRITLTLWARSHRNLAAGIQVPAMIDVMGIVKSTAKTSENKLLH